MFTRKLEGLIEEMNVVLSVWPPYVHCRATQAAGTVRRIARGEHNPRIDVGAI